MEFLQGQPLRLSPPPEQLHGERLTIHCPERPEVIIGQTVRRGQFILQPLRENESCFVSPITGTVRDISPRPGGGYRLILEPPGASVVTTLETQAPKTRKLDQWLAALREIGPWDDADGGVGLMAQLDAARNRPVHTLVCVGVDPFPPYPDRSSLLLSFPSDAVLGTLVLGDLLNADHVVMLAGRVPAMLGRLRASCKQYRLRLHITDSRYPAAHPTMVAHRLGPRRSGGRELPHGHNPVEQGLMMITPWTAIRLGRWITLRRFDLLRPVLLARGDQRGLLAGHWGMPGQSLVSISGEIDAALKRGWTILAGDPMTGRAIDEPHALPTDPTLLTIMPTLTPQAPSPCIQCGWCVDVCPTRLDPVGMFNASRQRLDDGWLADQLPWCIDCGLCSHVCPSALPLTQMIAKARQDTEAPD
jgi:electron transport complex protein RnfC